MNKDNLSTAFELISFEIEAVANEITEQGSKAFKEKRYDDAQVLADTGKKLKSFGGKVDQLLNEWEIGFDPVTRTRANMPKLPFQEKKHRFKRTKRRLHVLFKDGSELKEYHATDTFVQTLEKIGIETIEQLGISVRGVPLVGSSNATQYTLRRVGAKYIITHSSTDEKKKILDEISSRLNLGMTAKTID